MSDQVPLEVAGFTPLGQDGLGPEYKGWHNTQILELEIRDKKQKLTARPWIGFALSGLLILQNYAVFGMAFVAYSQGKIEEMAPVMSVICTATLFETAAIVHTMIKWIFSDMEYKTR